MASTIAWLIVGIFLVIVSIPATLIIGRRVGNPGRLVALVEEAAERGRGIQDPDARRSGMRWPGMYIPGFWCLALYSWPRTIDHLIRGEWKRHHLWSGKSAGRRGIQTFSSAVCCCVPVWGSPNYWNQPKFLVHPCFRGDPGLLAARRMRAQGVDVDAMYESSAERWRERQRRRRRDAPPG